MIANPGRLLLAALAAMIVYFLIGGVVFGLLPAMRTEFAKYPAVYRTPETMKPVAPVGMAAMFVAMLAVAVLYALACRPGRDAIGGAAFGALIGVFAVCAFVFHNYVNLNIGLKLTLEQAVAYFVQWTIVGVVIAAIYRQKPL